MHFNEIGVTERSIHYFASPSDVARRAYCHAISVGHFYCEAPYFLHRMRYDSFLAALVMDGCLMLRKGGTDIPVLPGGLMLVDCWQEHCYYTKDYCEFYFFHFDGPGCRPLVELIFSNNGDVLASPLGASFLQTFQTILEMHELSARPSEVDIAVKIYQFLCELSTRAQRGDARQRASNMDGVIEYIHEHLAEPLSLKTLARISNYSQGHLGRIFRMRTGISIYHYILLCRIDRAKHLLHTTQDSIHTIGQSVGFPSDANFVRVFTKYTGSSPSSFRKMGL